MNLYDQWLFWNGLLLGISVLFAFVAGYFDVIESEFQRVNNIFWLFALGTFSVAIVSQGINWVMGEL